ncbi:MAG: N-formylglutamate amidohydrolase [Alphaproteobacteria bacterium]|nr:N-formylglutamate amidohydrolase [Alphaproteobacteria bacterium]
MAGSKSEIGEQEAPAGPPGGGLLAPDEPGAFAVTNPAGRSSAVLVCDHASNRTPRCLGTLGLGPADLLSHIAWDPGAAMVARRLSELLDAPLVESGYSRLVIDCNRPLDSPESIPEQSAGVSIPGNRRLSAEDRARRIEALFTPYHDAIRKVVDARGDRPGLLLSIHSFTPVFGGRRRPWSIGLSYGRDERLVKLLLGAMTGDETVQVGENEPYSIDDETDYTIPVHGEARGLPHVLIEIRQDLLTTPADAARWAGRLAEAFRRIEPAALRLR